MEKNPQTRGSQKRGKAGSQKPAPRAEKLSCRICRVCFGEQERHISYVHHDQGRGEGDNGHKEHRVDFCYIHLLKITNSPGGGLPCLPTRQEPDFDLIEYLKTVKAILPGKKLDGEKTRSALVQLLEILDKVGLSEFIGLKVEFATDIDKPMPPSQE